jgi:hypothetical protein
MATNEELLRELKTVRAEHSEQIQQLRDENRAAWTRQQAAWFQQQAGWVRLEASLNAIWTLLDSIGRAADDAADAAYDGELAGITLPKRKEQS